MKRNIKDYEKKDVTIYCSSKEEWDKIDNLFGKKGLTRDYGDISNPDNMFVDCIHINGRGTASKKYYEGENYSIYPASDFLEEESKQFETGKWYHCNNMYAKCLWYKNNTMTSSCHIIDRTFYDLNKYRFNKGYRWALVEDLSEIQQYLPKDHPDKVIFERDYDIYDKNTIPEYVEWIDIEHRDGIKPGMIFKRKECKEPNQLYYTIDVKKLFSERYDYLQYYRKSFKPSTKEAFDLQNHELHGNNLLPNEIYVTNKPTDYIFKTSETGKGYSNYIYLNTSFVKEGVINEKYVWTGNIRLATIEEKKWLNTCITQDKFISKEDLHLYDNSGLLIQKENMEEIVEEANGFYIPIQNGKLLSQSIKKGFRKALPNEIPITSECIMYNGEIFEIKESFKTEIYDFGDIYIAPVIKKTKKLETITIESTTNLELNLTKIKSKQIKTIKI